MKCPTCGKEFSDGVCEIHREWCKDQPKAKKAEPKSEQESRTKRASAGPSSQGVKDDNPSAG